MDIRCQHCGEPCDVYHLNHDMEPEFREMFKAGKGCDSCEGKGEKDNSLRSEAMGICMEMMGDDIDGVASMMEHFEWIGMLDE